MPTVRQQMVAARDAGIAPAVVRGRFDELGLRREDLELEWPEAVRRGLARVKTETAGEVTEAARGVEGVFAGPPLSFKLLPTPAVPLQTEPGTAADVEPAAGKTLQQRQAEAEAAEKTGTTVAAEPQEWRLPTPARVSSRARGALTGAAVGALGKSKAARVLETGSRMFEALPTPLEVVSTLGGARDEPLLGLGRTKAERESVEREAHAGFRELVRPTEEFEKLPAVELDLERFKPGYLESAEERHRKGTMTGNILLDSGIVGRNWADSVWNFGIAMADLANRVAGVSVVKPGESEFEAAKRFGEQVGTALPGQLADMATHIVDTKDPSASAILVDPVGTWLTVVDPALRAMRLVPGLSGAAHKTAKAFRDTVIRPVVEGAVERVLGKPEARFAPTAWQDAVASIKRKVADGVFQGDRTATAVVEKLVHDPESVAARLRNMAEVVARQIEQGKVKPIRPGLVRTRLELQPAAVPREAAAAQKRAGAAEALRGQAQAREVLGGGLQQQTKGLAQATTRAQKKAVLGQRKTAEASLEAERVARGGPPPNEFQAAADELLQSGIAPKPSYRETLIRNMTEGLREDLAEGGNGRAGAERVLDHVASGKHMDFPLDKPAVLTPQTRKTLVDAADLAYRTYVGREPVAGVMKEAGKAAVAGVETAEAVKQLQPGTVESMAKDLASMQKRPARAAERAAEKARAEAEGAGERPAVYAGEVYLPPAVVGRELGLPPHVAKKLAQTPTLRVTEEPRLPSGAVGPQPPPGLGLRRRLPEVEAGAAADIEAAGAEASRLKKAALEAGFDPDAPASPQALAEAGLDAGTSLYDASRAVAELFQGRAVGKGQPPATGPEAVLSAALRRLGVADEAAAPAARWLQAEMELMAQSERVEPPYGAIRRPYPEEKEYTLQRATGTLAPEGAAGKIAEAGLAEKRAVQELRGMRGRRLVEEPPAAYALEDGVAAEALSDIAQTVRERGYVPEQALPGRATQKEPAKVDVSDPEAFVPHAEPEMKRLTEARVQQRLLEALEADSTQWLRTNQGREASLREFASRVKALGLKGKPFRDATAQFDDLVRDPRRVGDISKNRYFRITLDDGTPIWDRSDFGKVYEKFTDKAKLQADVFRDVADEMAKETQIRATLIGVNHEVNRFRRAPDGTTLEHTIGSPGDYAREVAKGVLTEGKTPPQGMPFAAETMLREMTGHAAAQIAAEIGVAPERVNSLGQWLGEFTALDADRALSRSLTPRGDFFRTTTDAPDFDLAAVHLKPSVAGSLRAHLYSLRAMQDAPAAARLVRELGQVAKKGVTALNLATHVNNKISNFLLQGMRRADPEQGINAVVVPLKWKAFLDGQWGRLTSEELRIFKGFAKTDIVNQDFVSREIGKTRLWQLVGESFGGSRAGKLAQAVRIHETLRPKLGKLGAAEAFGTYQDFHAEMYQKLGDLPDRLEEAMSAVKDASKKAAMMKPGASVQLPVGLEIRIVVEKLPDGRVSLTETGGPTAKRIGGDGVRLDSQEFADALARLGNFKQERLFFNYNKIGNFAKYLRGGPAALLSGIFAWFFKAADIPGIKRGLVAEILEHPYTYETTSPGVEAYQRRFDHNLAVRKALLTMTAQAAFADQRAMEDLRRANSWNTAAVGAVLAKASDPRFAWVRNLEPVTPFGPTTTVLQAVEALDSLLAFDLFGVDAAVVVKRTEDDKALTPEQRKIKELMIRKETGESFSARQALNMVGLGGGPLLNVLEQLKTAKRAGRNYGVGDGLRDLSKAFLGATTVKVADAALASAGVLADQPWAMRWSAYAKFATRQGYRGGDTATADEDGLAAYALRQLLGVGWSRALQGGKSRDPATTKQTYTRIDAYLRGAEAELKNSWVAAAENRVREAWAAVRHDPSGDAELRLAGARENLKTVKRVVESVVKDERKALRELLDKLSGKTAKPKALPAP